MHWLPLVAMVIASALPFPHNPVSRIAAATTEPGLDDRGEHRRDPAAARLAAPPVDYNLHGNASQTDYNMAAALSRRADRRDLQSRTDYMNAETENRGSYRSNSDSDRSRVGSDGPAHGPTLRTEDVVSQDTSLLKDYKSQSSSSSSSSSRQEYSSLADFSKKDNYVQDSRERREPVSTVETPSPVSPAADLKGQRGPEPTAPSSRPRAAPTAGTGGPWTPAAGGGPAEEGLTLEAALDLGMGLDGVLDGDEMFLDAHPRVLFSPSPSPPEHPPLLLMMETSLLDEDRDDREDVDGHIEGHGDRAIDRGATPGWADSPRLDPDAARAVRRDKRSHLMDRRRGEKSVCESESVWVTNKTSAVDSHGQKVTILQEIQTQTGPLKQYFYETRCRQAEQRSAAGGGGAATRLKGSAAAAAAAAAPAVAAKPMGTGVAGGGCLGVDKKQWLSECKARQSFVRALTKDANNRTGWRWIRIDSSCVCVLLSRTNQAAAREVLTRKGRG